MDAVAKMDTIQGTVENIVYHNDVNDYTVLELNCDDLLVVAVGEIAGVTEGEILVLRGSWTRHKDFGKQFSFTSYERFLPTEIEGIIQYLSSRTIKGVGPVTALKIVNRFGTDTFDVMENHPEWLADIPGITMKKAAAISESFREQGEFRRVMMFFGNKVEPTKVTRIYKKLGSESVGIIQQNPYVLCGVDYGLRFETVDSLAASFGFSPLAPERIFAGIEYALDFNAHTNGHTCLPKEKLIPAAAEILSVEPYVVSGMLEEFIAEDKIHQYSDGANVYVMTNDVREDEELIVRRIREMGRELVTVSRRDVDSMIESMENLAGIRYANLQRKALHLAMCSPVTVITGGPGTGKTTVVRALLSMFGQLGLKTVLAAPTGRAAKRLSETTSEEAKTIHRLLEMERTETENFHFNRNSRNPLEENAVIIDEASMVDLSLMASLMRALRRGTRLVLIGDSDQLPSVGAGNVLADVIASGAVETVCLTEIFRQAQDSLIVTNAHNINAGVPPVLNVTDNDFFFVRREEASIAATVAELIMTRLPRAYGEYIRDGIQVITPSKKGAGGVEVLNKELQAKINPPADGKKEKSAHGSIFREGDRVMQITNNYELEWEKNGITGYGVFNGDVGQILAINHREGSMTVRFDDRLLEYPFDNLDEMELAYAITVHKSQGSEYPVVIIPMYYCAPMLMTRNLLYTAVTRARKMVVLVGRADIPPKMVANNREVLRYTTLASRLSD
ncbi:MAG: ATP-dependent RecD-like DNA helicase [Clostridia bacterium]|nr:ATP-dependent RecD-like DNA helicase [Clostridia bacterium]